MTNKKIDDGGHAYPVCFEGGKNNRESPYFHEGMSLRDWFAGQAVNASLIFLKQISLDEFKIMAEKRNLSWKKGCMSELAAALSYETADAMIAARKAGAA